MHAQGLLDDPARQKPATGRAVVRLVEQMGFVQVDTISTVERAHHLILAARLNGYRPALLAHGIERKPRRLFEHWTHDASVIPLAWYPHWRHRFERHRAGGRWHRHQLGEDAEAVLAAVLERVRREGPLSSRDFEHERQPGEDASWWGWKPPKVALDYLWRCGLLHIAGRNNFQKVYDLPERVIPEHVARDTPGEEEHVDWACRSALERLGTATRREIVQFWNAVSIPQVTKWLTKAIASGDVLHVLVESADGTLPLAAFALPDLARRIARLPEPPQGVRLLCPFDPVIRDRARAKRLFDFDFRFEGFVPAAKRKHGYYVMPILDGDELIGRVDPKFDRATGVLDVRKVWWEPRVNPTRKRLASLEAGVETLAGGIGAATYRISV